MLLRCRSGDKPPQTLFSGGATNTWVEVSKEAESPSDAAFIDFAFYSNSVILISDIRITYQASISYSGTDDALRSDSALSVPWILPQGNDPVFIGANGAKDLKCAKLTTSRINGYAPVGGKYQLLPQQMR